MTVHEGFFYVIKIFWSFMNSQTWDWWLVESVWVGKLTVMHVEMACYRVSSFSLTVVVHCLVASPCVTLVLCVP